MLKNRSFQLWARRLHIYVSMALLLVVIFFTLTGLTLNRPQLYINDKPQIEQTQLTIPNDTLFHNGTFKVAKEPLLDYLTSHSSLRGFPSELDIYTEMEQDLLVFGEITLSYKAPGYNASVYIDMLQQTASIEQSNYGLIALLNDAHKGRNCGPIWQAFIDLTAVLMMLFIITGFCLIAPKRKTLHLSIKWMTLGTLATLLFYSIAIP